MGRRFEERTILDTTNTLFIFRTTDANELENILGGLGDNMEEYHLNSCFNLINSLKGRDDIGIVLEIGKEDFLWKTNQRFKMKLDELNIPHVYAEYPVGHQFNKESLFTMLANSQILNKQND